MEILNNDVLRMCTFSVILIKLKFSNDQVGSSVFHG